MPHIIGDYPVFASRTNVGHVAIAQDGLMTVFECACNFESRDILRLAAVCSGTYIPLGVMIPDSSALYMKKSFTKNALKSLGYQDTASFHLIRSGDVYSGGDLVSDTATDAERTDVLKAAAVSPEQPVTEEAPDNVMSAQDTDAVIYNDFPEPVDYDYTYGQEKASPKNPPEQIKSGSVPDSANAIQENAHTAAVAEENVQGKKDVLQELKAFLEIDDTPAPAVTGENESAAASAQSDAPPVDTTASGWVNIAHPSELFTDPSVKDASAGVYGALTTEQDGLVLLAVPMVPDEPFPMMPVFCFGFSGQIYGREYIIFKIKDGNLTL